MPRGKWHCPGCSQKGPRKNRKSKKPPTHILQQPPDIEDSSTTNSPGSVADNHPDPSSNNKRSNDNSDDEVSFNVQKKKMKKKKMSKMERDLTICTTLISEMEAHEDAGPFLFPVNTKQFPTYKKVVKQPMDIATIKAKLDSSKDSYKSREEFVSDVRLIFSNCELFNEDDSPVGKAGYAMRNLFETRWLELTS